MRFRVAEIEIITGVPGCLDPDFLSALANALEKLEQGSKDVPLESNEAVAHLYIVEPMHGQTMSFLNGKGMMRLFSTHPPIAERVKRLRSQDVGW